MAYMIWCGSGRGSGVGGISFRLLLLGRHSHSPLYDFEVSMCLNMCAQRLWYFGITENNPNDNNNNVKKSKPTRRADDGRRRTEGKQKIVIVIVIGLFVSSVVVSRMPNSTSWISSDRTMLRCGA